ncbi:hypothetical protein Fmac_022028 [Flemingia macrophylla]|uniref:TF-B3 domain-containing protein n=1 Tax=Flemingia macrophylla TaxID=520843 RepID=A0ABD1LYK2_9FABA
MCIMQYLPKGALKSYRKPGEQYVTLLVGDSSWKVKLSNYRNRSCSYFTAKWPLFAKDNDLKEGDACLFQILNYSDDELVMKAQQRKEEPSGAIRSTDSEALSGLKAVSKKSDMSHPLSGFPGAQQIVHIESGFLMEEPIAAEKKKDKELQTTKKKQGRSSFPSDPALNLTSETFSL